MLSRGKTHLQSCGPLLGQEHERHREHVHSAPQVLPRMDLRECTDDVFFLNFRIIIRLMLGYEASFPRSVSLAFVFLF